jgi:hypothetical protein
VDGHPHDVRAPGLDLSKIPCSSGCFLELVRVGDGDAAEDERLAGGVHELVALHAEGAPGVGRRRARRDTGSPDDAENERRKI